MAVYEASGDQMFAEVMNRDASNLGHDRIGLPDSSNQSIFDPDSAVYLKVHRRIGVHDKGVVNEGQSLAL